MLIFQRKPRAVPPQIRDRQSCQKRTFTQNGGSAILGKTELGDSGRVCNIVKQYSALKSIGNEAWSLVKVTTFASSVTVDVDSDVTEKVTTVTFTEGLLRNILDLYPDQQLELCKLLVKGKNSKGNAFTKKEFKNEAEKFQALNLLDKLMRDALKAVIPSSDIEPYKGKAWETIKSNSEYINEWLVNKSPGVKFQKLIESLIDEWQKKTSIQIIVKDIRDLTEKDIPDESVDVIITDRFKDCNTTKSDRFD